MRGYPKHEAENDLEARTSIPHNQGCIKQFSRERSLKYYIKRVFGPWEGN